MTKTITAALVLGFASLSVQALTFTTEESPPQNFSKAGKPTGFSVDILTEVLKRTGLQASISIYPWERAYKMALEEKDTCVFSATRTEQREKLFKWVGPLSSNNWVIFAKHDSAINLKSLDEAKPYKIGGYQGDATALFLKEKGFKVEETTNDEQNAKKLDAGRIDLWAVGSESGPWLARNAGVKVKPLFVFKETQIYLACNKSVGDDVVNKMNTVIKAMKTEGNLDKIYKNYR